MRSYAQLMAAQASVDSVWVSVWVLVWVWTAIIIAGMGQTTVVSVWVSGDSVVWVRWAMMGASKTTNGL